MRFGAISAGPCFLEVGYGIERTAGTELAIEPIENEIIRGDEVVDFALGVRDAIRHDDRAIRSGLPISPARILSFTCSRYGTARFW